MLIAFVLLGKNLEQRAKLKATSDMTGLLNILPSKARLMVDNDAEKSSLVEVPCDTLAVGDYVVVLPGVSTMYINIGDIGMWFLVYFFVAAIKLHIHIEIRPYDGIYYEWYDSCTGHVNMILCLFII